MEKWVNYVLKCVLPWNILNMLYKLLQNVISTSHEKLMKLNFLPLNHTIIWHFVKKKSQLQRLQKIKYLIKDITIYDFQCFQVIQDLIFQNSKFNVQLTCMLNKSVLR